MSPNRSTADASAQSQAADDEAHVFVRSPAGRHLVPLDLAREIEWALDVVDELLGTEDAEDGAA
jgi:hypothetical protein